MNPGETIEGHQGPVLQYAWRRILSAPDFVEKYKWKASSWGIRADRYPVKPIHEPSNTRFDMDFVITSDLEHSCKAEDLALRRAKKNLKPVYESLVNSLLKSHDAHCIEILDGAKPGSDLWESYSSTYMVPNGWLDRIDSAEAEKHSDRPLAFELVSSFMQKSFLLKGKGELHTEAGPPRSRETALAEESPASAWLIPGSGGGPSVQSHHDALSRLESYLERLHALIPPAQKAIDPAVVVGIAASIIGTECDSLERPTDYHSERSASVTPNPERIGAGKRVPPFRWKDPALADGTPDSDSESDGSSGSATPTQESTDEAARQLRRRSIAEESSLTFIEHKGQTSTIPGTLTSIESIKELP